MSGRATSCEVCGALISLPAMGGINLGEGRHHTCPSLGEARRQVERMLDLLDEGWQKRPPQVVDGLRTRDSFEDWGEPPWILRDQYLRLVERYEAGLVHKDDLLQKMYSFIDRVAFASASAHRMLGD